MKRSYERFCIYQFLSGLYDTLLYLNNGLQRGRGLWLCRCSLGASAVAPRDSTPFTDDPFPDTGFEDPFPRVLQLLKNFGRLVRR